MIKSTWKKILCVGISALLVTSAVSAASKKSSKKNPYKDVVKQKDPATKKVYNFGGMEIIIGDWWTNPDAPPATKQREDEEAFRKWTCDTYNMKITQKAVTGWENNPQFVTNFCVTGGNENYVFIIDARSAITAVRSNLFYDLSKIKSVNYKDASKYDQGVVQKLVKGNSFYAFNWGKSEPRVGVFFNKRILQENGYSADYPYDLQKEGKWTWETFEEMCKKITRDTDNDGIIDQYAMSSHHAEFCPAALDSNGGSIIGRDENGKFYNNAGSDKSMEAWGWIEHMWRNYQLPQPEGANWDYFYPAFVNGETAFIVEQEYNAQPNGRFADMKDDWGFVCFPLGPHGNGVYKTLHLSNMCVIPNCYKADKVEKIAKAVDLWLEPTPGYDGPDAWKEGYYSVFRDSRAVDETLTLMAKTPNPCFDSMITGLNTGDMIWGITLGYMSIQEAYESSKNVWQSLIDDTNR